MACAFRIATRPDMIVGMPILIGLPAAFRYAGKPVIAVPSAAAPTAPFKTVRRSMP